MSNNGHAQDVPPVAFQVTFERKTPNGPASLVLPTPPGDPAGICSWLTCVLALDRKHPITGGQRDGPRNSEGRVTLTRHDAPGITFEPVARLSNPLKLLDTLNWQKIPTDKLSHALKAEHCRILSHTVVVLCGPYETLSDKQQTLGMIGTLLAGAELVEGFTTHGQSTERYRAARALHRVRDATGAPAGPPQCLLDANTGELVVSVSDMQEVARREAGSTVAHGWLDGRMNLAEWERIEVKGRETPGRAGLGGPNARINAYRGFWLVEDEDDGR